MPISLSSGKSGFGLGIRPMKHVIIAGRTLAYSTGLIIHPDAPNGAFSFSGDNSSFSVFGADGNLSGTLAASAAIDGTGQNFVNTACTYSAGYFWTFVENAANELRLIRAGFNGSIVTPGAKFTPLNAGILSQNNKCFVYESGNNIVVRAQKSSDLILLTVSKITGQIVSEQKIVDSNAFMATQIYVTENGVASIDNISRASGNTTTIGMGTYNGTRVKDTAVLTSEMFGTNDFSIAGTWRPILIGEYILFISSTGTVGVYGHFKRSDFDRWIIDLCKKFDYAE